MEFVSDTQSAVHLPIEDWASEQFTEDYASNNNIDYWEIQLLKEKIMRLFNAYGWYVINPPGDGFCGIYVTKIAYEMFILSSINYSTLLTCPVKEFFWDIIIMGIEFYRAIYKQLELDLVKYINLSLVEIDNFILRLDAGKNIEEITPRMHNKPIAKMLISMYRTMLRHRFIPLNASENIELHLDNDFTIDGILKKDKAEEFKQIELAGDVDIQILSFLAYAYEHNYIVLQYEKWSQMGDLNARCTYHRLNYNYYEITWPNGKKTDLKEHTIKYNSQSDEEYKRNTSILFNDAHFVLIHNIDKTVTEQLIQEFMAPNGEQLWRQNDAFTNLRAFFRVPYFFLNSRGKRLKRRQLKQTVKYRNRKTLTKLYTKPRSKLQTLKLKKINSKTKAKQKQNKSKTKAKQKQNALNNN